MRALVALTVAGLAVLPSVASADAPWSAPRDLSPSAEYVFTTGPLDVGAGRFLFTWRPSTPLGSATCPAAAAQTHVFTLDRDRKPSKETVLGGSVVAGPIALGAGGALLAMDQDTSTSSTCDSGVTVLALDARRRFRRAISLEDGAQRVRVASFPDGRALIVYGVRREGKDGRTGTRIRLRSRRAGGAYSGARTIATVEGSGGLSDLALATDAAGRTVVAYAQDACVSVRRRRACRTVRDVRAALGAPGRPLGRFVRIGPSDGRASLAATLATTGRAHILWGTQDGGEEAGKPWRILSATAEPGRRFGGWRTLDAGEVARRPSGDVALAALPDGRAVASWSGITPGAFPVRARVLRADGSTGATTELAPSGSVVGTTVAPGGALTVLLGRTSPLPFGHSVDAVLAARLAPGAATFAPTETVAAGYPVLPTGVAADPRDGSVVAAWSGRPGLAAPAQEITPSERLQVSFRP